MTSNLIVNDEKKENELQNVVLLDSYNCLPFPDHTQNEEELKKKKEEKKREFCPMRQVNELTKRFLANDKFLTIIKQQKQQQQLNMKNKKLKLENNIDANVTTKEKKKTKSIHVNNAKLGTKSNIRFYELRMVDMFLFLLSERTKGKEKKNIDSSSCTSSSSFVDWKHHISKDVIHSFEQMVEHMIYFFQQCDYYEICQIPTGGSVEVQNENNEENPSLERLIQTSPCLESFLSSNISSFSSFIQTDNNNQTKEEKENNNNDFQIEENSTYSSSSSTMSPQIKEINLKNSKYKSHNLFFLSSRSKKFNS